MSSFHSYFFPPQALLLCTLLSTDNLPSFFTKKIKVARDELLLPVQILQWYHPWQCLPGFRGRPDHPPFHESLFYLGFWGFITSPTRSPHPQSFILSRSLNFSPSFERKHTHIYPYLKNNQPPILIAMKITFPLPGLLYICYFSFPSQPNFLTEFSPLVSTSSTSPFFTP